MLRNIEIISDNDKVAWEFIQETYGPKVKDWNPVDVLNPAIDILNPTVDVLNSVVDILNSAIDVLYRSIDNIDKLVL